MQSGVIESIQRNGVALKGPLETAGGKGARSLNVALRQALDLYANVRPVKNLEGVQSVFQDVDIVLDSRKYRRPVCGPRTYGGAGSCGEPEDHHGKSIHANRQVSRLNMRESTGARKIHAIHKANIMKLSDGLFLTLDSESGGRNIRRSSTRR